MKLTSVTPRMIFEKNPPHQGRPAVLADYTMKCRNCPDGVLTATTANCIITREQDIEKVHEHIRHALGALIKVLRKCRACGSYSGLSDHDEDRLAVMLHIIDSAWIADQIAGLGVHKPFHIVHEESVAAGNLLAAQQPGLDQRVKRSEAGTPETIQTLARLTALAG